MSIGGSSFPRHKYRCKRGPVYDAGVRLGDIAALVALVTAPVVGGGVGGAVAHAEPSVEATASSPAREPRLHASGFVGIGFLNRNTQLGDSWAPEQVPGNAPLFGLRLSVLAVPTLADLGAGRRFQLAVEAEAVLATGTTRPSEAREGRMTYFAPVFGWHGHLLVRYIDDTVPLRPHLLAGAGGATVASESPYMRKETDPVVYYGGGFAIPLTATWQVRIDAHHGLMPARGGGISSLVELQLGFGGSFGFPEKRTPARPATPPPEQPDVDERDRDRDGLPDHLDQCPTERETVNGLLDGDGCPEPDSDGDSILGAGDRCPDQAEDKDGWQDEDGCPEPDNDGDGLVDAVDKCPDAPETRNGFDDGDGCPDSVPADITKLLAAASTITFETNRARVTDRARKKLAPVIELMLARKGLRVAITARPAKTKDIDLAKRRAEAVKWYLVDEGIGEGRFVTRVTDPQNGPAVELSPIVE